MDLTRVLKGLVRDCAFRRWQQRQRDRKEITEWEVAGRPCPPPPAFKRQLIREVARRFGTRVLMKTGTDWGLPVAASLGAFDAATRSG
jgi:hypothetical protein